MEKFAIFGHFVGFSGEVGGFRSRISRWRITIPSQYLSAVAVLILLTV